MSTTNPNCWVQFWENDSYGSGGTHKFSYDDSQPALTNNAPYYIDDLSEYYWDGYSESWKNGMDDSISSLKTGSSTWLYLFSQHNFEGDVLQVAPGSSIPKLSSYRDADGDKWDNTTVSFVMYNTCPPGWDSNQPTQAGTCWVKLYTGSRYTNTCFMLSGAGEMPNAACLPNYRTWQEVWSGLGYTNSYVYSYPQSLTTGPSTWVELYGDTNYTTLLARFGPNSLVRDLSAYSATNINSLKIYAAAPSSFSQSGQTPNVVLTVEKYETAAKLSDVLAGALGCIPNVGGMLSGLLLALWPTGPSSTEVWMDLSGYISSLIESEIDQTALLSLNDKLGGYEKAISQYVSMTPGTGKASQLDAILNALALDSQYFLNTNDPQSTLPYMVAFGNISVLLLAEQAYNYSILSGGATNPNAATAVKNLDNAIATLSAAVAQAITSATAWRVSQLSVTEQGSISTDYIVRDAYTGYSAEYSKQSDANAALNQLQTYITAQYTELLQAFGSPASQWGYFYSANTSVVASSGNPNFPTTAFKVLPTRQPVKVSVGSLPNSSAGTNFSDQLNGGRITGVTLYATAASPSAFVSGIQFFYSNEGSGIQGKTGPTSLHVALDSDENIVAMYGGSGSYVDQLFFRTDKGRDFGLGGSGGTDYVGMAPQGADAAVVAITGVYGTYLYSILVDWQYEQGSPYPG